MTASRGECGDDCGENIFGNNNAQRADVQSMSFPIAGACSNMECFFTLNTDRYGSRRAGPLTKPHVVFAVPSFSAPQASADGSQQQRSQQQHRQHRSAASSVSESKARSSKVQRAAQSRHSTTTQLTTVERPARQKKGCSKQLSSAVLLGRSSHRVVSCRVQQLCRVVVSWSCSTVPRSCPAIVVAQH